MSILVPLRRRLDTAMTRTISELEKNLQQREKAELIALIRLIFHLRPDLAWTLQMPLPVPGKSAQPIDVDFYRRQIDKAISAVLEHKDNQMYQNTLEDMVLALQSAAHGIADFGDYPTALTLYEMLAAAETEHYFSLDTEYPIFLPNLFECIEGLDNCFTEAGTNQEMRQRALKALFAIYRFSTHSYLDVGEDIPDLLVESTTLEERQMIAGWVRDTQARVTGKTMWSKDLIQDYQVLLDRLGV